MKVETHNKSQIRQKKNVTAKTAAEVFAEARPPNIGSSWIGCDTILKFRALLILTKLAGKVRIDSSLLQSAHSRLN